MKTVKTFRLKTLLLVFVLQFALPAMAEESDEFAMDDEYMEEAQPPALPADSHLEYLLVGGILLGAYKFRGYRKGKKQLAEKRFPIVSDPKKAMLHE